MLFTDWEFSMVKNNLENAAVAAAWGQHFQV